MTTYVCINVWEHAKPLERAIATARAFIPDSRVVVVDGVYAQFPWQDLGKQPFSTDGTLEIAQEFADTIIWRKDPWPNEIVKRSSYLIGKPGDVYVHLDADEYIVGMFPGLEEPYQDAEVTFIQTDVPDRPTSLYRVFTHREGIEYRHTHASLWAGDVHLNQLPRYVLPHLKMIHTIGVNDEVRSFAKGKYYKWLAEAEKNPVIGRNMKVQPTQPSEKTETLQFLGITRSCYVGKFSMTKAGETREVSVAEAQRLYKTFPMDFRILPKPRKTEKSAGVPTPEQVKDDPVVFRTVRYKGDRPTRINKQVVNPGETARIEQRLAAILVHTGLYEILEGETPAASPPEPTKAKAQ